MDMHIYMSFCTFPALKILIKNYLGYDEADLDGEDLKELEMVVGKAQMTPADVSEVLIKNRRYKHKAVKELLESLKAKAEKNKNNDGSWEKIGNRLEDEEEEEEEKRALESPNKQGFDRFQEETCKKGDPHGDDQEEDELIERNK